MNKAVIRSSERIYGFLLKFYPKSYRQEFGEEMKYVFSESLKDACAEYGEQGLIGLWVRTIIDVGKSLVTQHLENRTEDASMKPKRSNIIMPNKNIIRLALVTAFILLLPLLAMQFTNEVAWGLADFVFAGALLFGAGLTYELVARKAGNLAYRLAVGVALATAFILIWVNLAVGLIGSEDELANLMYIGVLAVGIIGALIVRFQTRGMARVLLATALAQVLVTMIALVAGMQHYPGSSVFEILGVNGFFIALWVGSALLFRQASATGSNGNRRLDSAPSA
jgi:hypothetical protein